MHTLNFSDAKQYNTQRSYGDKPREFMAMVPNGLLPALTIDMPDGKKQVITESQVIMDIIDKLHPPSDGYLPMMPESDDLLRKHQELAKLERELFSWWCNLIFRPETGGGGGMASLMGSLMGGGSDMSGSMRGFLDCLERVDSALRSTSGPWFLGSEHPMMIDFIFVSHIERMLASCAYWKGLQIRGAGKWKGIDAWFDAFDQRPSYLAFKSDFYTNIMDIPPQYGFCYDGGFDDKREKFQSILLGRDGKSWTLPLAHDAIPLEPLYQGPPLPQNVLEAVSLTDYKNSDPMIMAKVCRQAAGWKLASNGIKVSRFAARGGSRGGKNARKSFQAPLADPYADPDDVARPSVDKVLQIVCEALLDESDDHDTTLANLTPVLKDAVDSDVNDDVASSLAYLRDRVGVPRDMPLAAARHFRAHLNWAIDAISS